jgi:3'-phosphoadenosine 5'-phosphosulfate sulfotransferase (PAPS reductase)/FAD synthetase
MKRIVSYSGGLGSFMAAQLTVAKYGKENTLLVFTDTKTEDEDLYRFLNETSQALDCELLTLADGRNIWEVFIDVRFQGNSRIDPCSRVLKRELFRKWMESKFKPDEAALVVGISHDEKHRMTRIKENWQPYQVEAPLCEVKVSKEDILNVLDDYGIDPPRIYEQGFPHNNCGGFCVKTGQKQMKLLLEKNPERYRWHEEQQEKLFKIIGKRHGFIRKNVDGEMHYLGLREFRESLEKGEQPDLFVENGCGCFI